MLFSRPSSKERAPTTTCATPVVMAEPPEAPTTIKTREWSGERRIAGDVEDCGLLPGSMKLLGPGGRLSVGTTFSGREKSAISLLKMSPNLEERILLPK